MTSPVEFLTLHEYSAVSSGNISGITIRAHHAMTLIDPDMTLFDVTLDVTLDDPDKAGAGVNDCWKSSLFLSNYNISLK